MRVLFLLLLIFGGFYLVLLIFLFFYQSRMIYFPTPRLATTPARLGLEYEEVRLTAGPNTIHGWFLPPDSGCPVVLFCHGNAGNIADRLETLQIIRRAGSGVLIFDYSGFGQSTGRPTESQTYADAAAALEYLMRRGFRPEEIVVYGRSLGAAVAAHLAQDQRFRALVLEGAFTSMVDVAARHYPWVPVGLLLRSRYPTQDYVRRTHSPVVIVHSRQDELVPFAMAERLLAAAPEPRRLVESSGDHNALSLVDWKDPWATGHPE